MNTNLIKSKIFWIQVIGIVIVILEAAGNANPPTMVYTIFVANLLTVVMRFLQGKDIQIGSRTIKM